MSFALEIIKKSIMELDSRKEAEMVRALLEKKFPKEEGVSSRKITRREKVKRSIIRH